MDKWNSAFQELVAQFFPEGGSFPSVFLESQTRAWLWTPVKTSKGHLGGRRIHFSRQEAQGHFSTWNPRMHFAGLSVSLTVWKKRFLRFEWFSSSCHLLFHVSAIFLTPVLSPFWVLIWHLKKWISACILKSVASTVKQKTDIARKSWKSAFWNYWMHINASKQQPSAIVSSKKVAPSN